MVPAQKHRRHSLPLKNGWTRIHRRRKQIILKRILQRRRYIAQNPRDQPHNPIYQHQRWKLSPRQDIIPDRDLARYVGPDSIIYALVVPSDEKKAGF
jgi:hypothetical protein